MVVNLAVFKCLAFNAALCAWLLAVSLTSHLGWVTSSIFFAATFVCLLLIMMAKIEPSVNKRQVFLFCVSVFLSWILVSLPFRCFFSLIVQIY